MEISGRLELGSIRIVNLESNLPLTQKIRFSKFGVDVTSMPPEQVQISKMGERLNKASYKALASLQ